MKGDLSRIKSGASLFRAPAPADLTDMLMDLADPSRLKWLPYLKRRLLPFSSSSVSLPLSITSSLFFETTLRRLDVRLDFRLEVVLIFDAVDARLDFPLLAVDRCDLLSLLPELLLFPDPCLELCLELWPELCLELWPELCLELCLELWPDLAEAALRPDLPLFFEAAVEALVDFPEAWLDRPLCFETPVEARVECPLFPEARLEARLDFPLLFDPRLPLPDLLPDLKEKISCRQVEIINKIRARSSRNIHSDDLRMYFPLQLVLFLKAATTLLGGSFIYWAHVTSLTCKANVQSTNSSHA